MFQIVQSDKEIGEGAVASALLSWYCRLALCERMASVTESKGS